jgi:hypothetical protein
MTISADAQQKMDAYLKVLRKRLRGLRDQDASDIVREIRSHIWTKRPWEKKTHRAPWSLRWPLLAAPKNSPAST